MRSLQAINNLLPQLPLGLSLRDEATFDNFVAGANNEVLDHLRMTVAGSSEYRYVYLCGTRGYGSSHLLQASCHYAYSQDKTSVYLPLSQSGLLDPSMLHGLEQLFLVCIDDLQAIAGNAAWEEGIFHLYNRMRDAGGSLIVAANELPKNIGIQLPDLVSRLSWGLVYQLHPLADTEKLTVLTTRAKCRGMTLPDDVGKYILTHCPRHMATLIAALDVLDSASLAAQRRLTIPFVKEILQI